MITDTMKSLIEKDSKEPVKEFEKCAVEFFIVEVNIKIENKTKKKQYSIIAPSESFVRENILAHLGGEIVKIEKQPCFIIQVGQEG